jgi:hypothetical protein
MKMKNTNPLLDHLEKVHDEYEELIDKIPMEDKLIMSREEALAVTLEPWEISEITQAALNDLPENLEGHVDDLFDVVYEAILEALDRARR